MILLNKEKNYAFRKRMLEIHPKDIRQEGLLPRDGEFVIENGLSIHENGAQTAAGGFTAAFYAVAAVPAHKINQQEIGVNMVSDVSAVEPDCDFHHSSPPSCVILR